MHMIPSRATITPLVSLSSGRTSSAMLRSDRRDNPTMNSSYGLLPTGT
jgi:hypothetical protein